MPNTISVHQLIESIITILDARDPYTYEHSERVAALSEMLATEMNLKKDEISKIHFAAHLHDIGKAGVPDHVLNKVGFLTPEEFTLMKSHPEIGYNIVKNIDVLASVSPCILYHHERFDGLGYPAGLKGMDIPIGARIISTADTFDAMTSNRTYKSRMTVEKAFDELARVKGTQLCPEVVNCFIDNREKVIQILNKVNEEVTHGAFFNLSDIQSNRSQIQTTQTAIIEL